MLVCHVNSHDFSDKMAKYAIMARVTNYIKKIKEFEKKLTVHYAYYR